MRGRKPKPSALKKFEGNPGKRALNQNKPKPAVQTPDCPVHRDNEAQAEWNRITPDLNTLGLTARIDRAALAAYCQAWSRWVKAEEMLKSSGPVIKSKTTIAIYQNPDIDLLTAIGVTYSPQ